MMDRKFILYILVGVAVFALWDAWQKDYGQVNDITSSDVVTTPITKNKIKRSSGKVSTTSKIKRNKNKKHFTIPSSRLVKVKTDVLDVTIDTVGGNIIKTDLLKYSKIIYQKKPVEILNNNPQYFYVTQSGLISDVGPDSEDRQAKYKSVKNKYNLSPDKNKLQVKLYWTNNKGIEVVKIFSFKRGKYDIAVDYEINNKSRKVWSGQFYAELKKKNLESSGSFFQLNTYNGASISSSEKPYEKISFSDIEDATKKDQEIIRDSLGGWVAMQQRYFLSVWIPAQDKVYSYFNNVSKGIYTIGLSDSDLSVAVGKKKIVGATLYVGPEITENIAPLAKGLDRTVDYGWLWVISIGFFWILKNIYKFVGNWGWAIILITLLIKLVFYKLSESSCRSMAKMRELMPKMQALKERYGDDRQKLHQATMELYKREKISPLNFGGCLPMLIQIPFFIALYYVLIGAVELRHAPFMFWIHDLASRDPYYILPVLMGLSMFLQQRLSPSSPDPTQAKMMMFMPVVFTVFFLNFPSGLVLYWLVSNLLSILQQWYINRKLGIGGVKACQKT